MPEIPVREEDKACINGQEVVVHEHPQKIIRERTTYSGLAVAAGGLIVGVFNATKDAPDITLVCIGFMVAILGAGIADFKTAAGFVLKLLKRN